MTDAAEILNQGVAAIADRAAERDTTTERSMARSVRIFNAACGHGLTEEEGWMFMVCLKLARSRGGKCRLDDYIDGAAYFALAGESRGGRTAPKPAEKMEWYDESL